MHQTAASTAPQQGWTTIGWQGVTMRVPEDWYPAALGTERASGYLRVQSAESHALEVKWFTPRGTVDMEKELEKYRKTMERAARKRRQSFEWRAKPKVPIRESHPDKNRRFFGWSSEGQALGVVWYCRTCGRVVIAQVTTPREKDASSLAASILNSVEDHGSDGQEVWALYGLHVAVPEGWSLDRHQLMAGYTMLQFRRGDRVLRTERWALANVALKDSTLRGFLWDKCYRFWRDFGIAGADGQWRGHPSAEFTGRTRKLWVRVSAPVRRLVRRPAADCITVRAWHCEVENKVFAVHSVHPRGEAELLERVVESIGCH